MVVVPTQPIVMPANTPSAQDVINYNQNMRAEESRLQAMIRSLMSSPYMPTRDQLIQVSTTVLTLLLMMLLGPVMGANAGIVQQILKQIVPFLVAASVHYAADNAMPPTSKPINAPIVSVPVQPVLVQPSTIGQTF